MKNISVLSFFRNCFDRWIKKRIPPNESIHLKYSNILILPSRYGLIYLSVMVAVFICGANYANSLMLLLSYLLFSLFLLVIIYTYRNLSGLCISACEVQSCFVGEQVMFKINIMRGGNRRHERIRFGFKDTSIHSSSDIVDLIDHKEASVEILVDTKARGYLRPGRLKIDTVFPLGIVRSFSLVDLNLLALVYPKPIKHQNRPLMVHTKKDSPIIDPNGSEDFYGFRNYMPGDPITRCYWKSISRGMPLSTKVFVNPVEDALALSLDQVPGDDLERRLSYLCYWIIYYSDQNRVFSVSIGDFYLPSGEGSLHRALALKQLAKYALPSNPL